MSVTDITDAGSPGRRGGLTIEGLSPIEEVLEDYRAGRMVILVDDEDRENEGDLLIAADCITSDHINFMASNGRGLICLTLTHDRCEQLGLELQTRNNNERYSTNFTVSIEAAEGVTTGISAADRATTVTAAVREGATPGDIVTPGHIFPIRARAGGVLTRAGHTEAGVDLARLSGHSPSSVICEILNADGSMARLPELLEFARSHDLKIGTIEDLIRYRLKQEPTVHRLEQYRVDPPAGGDSDDIRVVAYQDVADDEVHLAIVCGDISGDSVVPVRVQLERGLYDVVDRLDRVSGAAGWTTESALDYMRANGGGVVVLLQYRHSAVETLDRLRAAMHPATETDPAPGAPKPEHLRVIGLGSQILSDLGLTRLQVLGSPVITHGLAGFDLSIEQYVPVPGAQPEAADSVARAPSS